MPIAKLRQFKEVNLHPETHKLRKQDWVYCSAITLDNNSEHYTQWRTDRYKDDSHPHECCRRIAVVMVDDRAYCRLHAGRLALDKWIKGELTESPPKATEEGKRKSKAPKST